MGGAILIDGRAIAEQVHAETASRVKSLQSRGLQPGLLFVRVGEDPASKVYVGMKEKTAGRLGILSETRVLAESTTENQLVDLLTTFNHDPRFHGILVQAPLPSHINSARIYSTVSPSKDVDGFHPVNVGRLLLGDSEGFAPCTPAGIQRLLIATGIPTEGADVVILGRGDIVGKPMASILCQKSRQANATVTICHSRSRDVASHCRRADIIIAAMGVPRFLKADMVKRGAVVVDVGVNRIADPTGKDGTRLVGDVDFDAVQSVAGWITPNPGGVGPMTIAMLMQNTVRAAEQIARFS